MSPGDDPPAPLDTTQAAKYCGVSKSTVEHWRTKGGGPRYFKPSPSIVRYRIADLDAWLADRTFRHTAEDNARKEGGGEAAAP